MKANMPRSWWNLPKSERDSLQRVLTEQCYELLNKEEAELQEIWIKLACIVLHEVYGFGDVRLMRFIAHWKRIYRRNARNKDKAAQTAWIEAELTKCFPKYGFPQDRIQEMKDM